jgi:hypothetical protein
MTDHYLARRSGMKLYDIVSRDISCAEVIDDVAQWAIHGEGIPIVNDPLLDAWILLARELRKRRESVG